MHVYKAAVALFSSSSLIDSPSLKASVEGSKELFTKVLFHQSGKIFMADDPKEPSKKLLFWPLVIAGIETPSDGEITKGLARQQLGWLSKTLENSSPLVARDSPDNLWTGGRAKNKYQRRGWDGMFDRSYVFML